MSPLQNPRLRLSHVHVELSLELTRSRFMNPQGSGPFIAAAHWIQGTLLGTVATVAAVVAVAVVGMLMLTGRINWR